MCEVCQSVGKTTWFNLPVLGHPVGIDLCNDCIELICLHIETMIKLSVKGRGIGYHTCKLVHDNQDDRRMPGIYVKENK